MPREGCFFLVLMNDEIGENVWTVFCEFMYC